MLDELCEDYEVLSASMPSSCLVGAYRLLGAVTPGTRAAV